MEGVYVWDEIDSLDSFFMYRRERYCNYME